MPRTWCCNRHKDKTQEKEYIYKDRNSAMLADPDHCSHRWLLQSFCVLICFFQLFGSFFLARLVASGWSSCAWLSLAAVMTESTWVHTWRASMTTNSTGQDFLYDVQSDVIMSIASFLLSSGTPGAYWESGPEFPIPSSSLREWGGTRV